MAVHADSPGPYTSPRVVIDLIQRFRDKGLPTPIDLATLTRAGVSESLAPRTLQSFRVLDLITESGEITPVFESLRRAPEAEFKDRVKQWLDAAYADVLQFVDPATATETNVRDAFRNYKPIAQQDRMVSLFLRLYEFAGVTPTIPAATPNGQRKLRVLKRPKLKDDNIKTNNVREKDEPEKPSQALHHQLVDILSTDMTDEQKSAVWTLVLYLKEKDGSGK